MATIISIDIFNPSDLACFKQAPQLNNDSGFVRPSHAVWLACRIDQDFRAEIANLEPVRWEDRAALNEFHERAITIVRAFEAEVRQRKEEGRRRLNYGF